VAKAEGFDGPGAVALQFLGATGTVTGSRFLLETPRARVLVDCGLYQGIKALRRRNWEPFPVEPASLDAVVLSHAHIDHCGYLPALVRTGFGGPVVATQRTAELCGIVLPDSARLQEEDAAYANRKGYSKHRPALSLYTQDDARAALERFRSVSFGQAVEVAEGVRATLRPAGHILGSASVVLEVDGAQARRVAVSGDLGRPGHPLLVPPEPLPGCDALLVESTYGDRRHDDISVLERLRAAVLRSAARGGFVVIPAFAVDRTEVVLFHLKRLMDAGQIPPLPVDLDIRPELRGMPEPFDPGQLVEARGVEDSRAIDELQGPAIILSASGMATGGRVLHHLAHRLPKPHNSVVLVGFQAAETRGRRLLEGARLLKMLGRYVPVRAEIVDCTALSVHADRSELLQWLGCVEEEPELSYVVHGEPAAAESLRDAIEAELGWSSVVPSYLERVRVDRTQRGGD
jgi:metallo-beta-lactamase family protein